MPEQAIDAQSLIAFADLVVSAGGTMNREAVALGTPVCTTFEGRLGAVDERLIAEGRLRRLERAADLDLAKRPPAATERVRRDPAVLVECCARRSGGLPQLAGEDALGPQPPLGGQAPELGRRARAGQVARRRDLDRRQPAEAPDGVLDAGQPAVGGRPGRGRRGAQRGDVARVVHRARGWLAGRRAAGRNSNDGNGTRRRCSVWVPGAAARVRSRSAAKASAIAADCRSIRKRSTFSPGTRRAASRQRVGVVHALRSNMMPSRTTRRYGPSRPCSAAALTAWHAGYDDRGGESSHTRGSIGIPLAAHASSTWCMVSTGRLNSRANPPIT